MVRKFCSCHHDIVIYRFACQDKSSLCMTIAKCVAKRCGAKAKIHHAERLRKHFQETVIVSACISALFYCPFQQMAIYHDRHGSDSRSLPFWISQQSPALQRVNYALSSDGISFMRGHLLGDRLACR